MKLPGISSMRRLSAARIFGIALVVVGVILLLLAYDAQTGIDDIVKTNDPALQTRLSALENERNAYVVASIGTLFIGLFAIAILSEPSLPKTISNSEMVSVAQMAGQTLAGLSLKGNATYLPAKHGLNREKVFVPASGSSADLPVALSEDLTMSPGKDGSMPGIIVEPFGLVLLDEIERELGTSLKGAGLETAEGSLQMLKHGLGMMRDFHFKEREGKSVLRVEYSGLLEACRTVRKERPDTCRQLQCVGCACLLSAAARATDKRVDVESVDNSSDTVEFTLKLGDW
jgi:hypothetical protein